MIFGILNNTREKRYHPIALGPAPMPGAADPHALARRYRSVGHHTEGFQTLAEAKAYVADACRNGDHRDSGAIWKWDGVDVPASVELAFVEWVLSPASAKELTPRQTELIRHALGLDRSTVSYRNSFIAGEAHADYEEWMALARNGCAVRIDGSSLHFGGDHLFRATLEGACCVLRPGERLEIPPQELPARAA